jgi:hypothetical protein
MKSNIQMCFGRELAGGGPAPLLLSLEHPKEDVMRMSFLQFHITEISMTVLNADGTFGSHQYRPACYFWEAFAWTNATSSETKYSR